MIEIIPIESESGNGYVLLSAPAKYNYLSVKSGEYTTVISKYYICKTVKISGFSQLTGFLPEIQVYKVVIPANEGIYGLSVIKLCRNR